MFVCFVVVVVVIVVLFFCTNEHMSICGAMIIRYTFTTYYKKLIHK